MFPVRLSLVTYNLWNTRRWPERAPALEQFVQVLEPDILCLQEVRLETLSLLDAALPRHRRVRDDTLPGWTCEGNVYWRGDLLQEIEYGAEDVGILEEHRRLFWVRLALPSGQTVFVSTAHFTYQGNPRELETGLSPRIEQARRTAAALQWLVRPQEPAFFMGDLNDAGTPVRILREAEFVNCFAGLGVLSPPTMPCMPTKNIELGTHLGQQTIDWLMANQYARPIAAQVPHFYQGDMAPSDHWPVLAVYEI